LNVAEIVGGFAIHALAFRPGQGEGSTLLALTSAHERRESYRS
jgi:hypothetical protein